jgi:hypothetical protein
MQAARNVRLEKVHDVSHDGRTPRGLAQPNCASALCDKCIFKREWIGASPCNKLCFYGVSKLRLLAERKLPKGHWKLDREGLITALGPFVRDSDFPIAA